MRDFTHGQRSCLAYSSIQKLLIAHALYLTAFQMLLCSVNGRHTETLGGAGSMLHRVNQCSLSHTCHQLSIIILRQAKADWQCCRQLYQYGSIVDCPSQTIPQNSPVAQYVSCTVKTSQRSKRPGHAAKSASTLDERVLERNNRSIDKWEQSAQIGQS